jgi:hypothetical protein
MIRARWLSIAAATVAGIHGLFGVAFAWAGEPAVRTIGGERQLFLDDWIIAQTANVVRQPGEVVKCVGNPIIKRDKAWDAGRCDIYGSAVYDPTANQLQVFYSAVSLSNGHDDRLAYAVSNDRGATWTKPVLGLVPFHETRDNNLLLAASTAGNFLAGPCVFRDEHETDPAKRYKMFDSEYFNTVQQVDIGNFLHATGASVGAAGMYVAYSPDGIHWTRPSTQPVSNMFSDTAQSAFWDARLGKYVAYVRARVSGVRSVGRMESSDFVTWSEPQLVFHASREVYSMGVTPYGTMYIGTPWIFDTSATGDNPNKPAMWPELAVSRDGIEWSQPFAGKPLIPTGLPNSGDSAQIRMSSSLVMLDDKIVFIYGQTDRGHVADMRVDIGMATMRLDGFAAMAAGDQQGTLRTKPFVLDGKRLFINAAIDAFQGGSIRVAVLDQAGNPITGFSSALSVPITGDGIRLPVAWEQGSLLERLAGQTVQLEFQMQNASLYSFVVQDPEVSGVSVLKALVICGHGGLAPRG